MLMDVVLAHVFSELCEIYSSYLWHVSIFYCFAAPIQTDQFMKAFPFAILNTDT